MTIFSYLVPFSLHPNCGVIQEWARGQHIDVLIQPHEATTSCLSYHQDKENGTWNKAPDNIPV